MKKLIATAGLLLVVPMLASAQNADHQYNGQGYLFFAEGATGPATFHFGGGGEGFVYKGLGLGAELEHSAGWSSGTSLGTWIGSADVSYHFGASTKNRKLEPFVTGGYTFFFIRGISPSTDFANGGNFGCGVNIWLKKHAALRLEIRDSVGGRNISIDYEPWGTSYLAPQHLVSFRIGVTFR
jgi:hypothetical protein